MPFPWLPHRASVTKPVLQTTSPDRFWWPKRISSGQPRRDMGTCSGARGAAQGTARFNAPVKVLLGLQVP